MSSSRQFWLMKSEPGDYSIEDLRSDKATWSGVRNCQARNFMRDQMRVGDGVLFYHSRVEPIGIAGTAEVIKTGYPDDTAWDTYDKHYDPKSKPDKPIWFMVDIQFVKICRTIITLKKIKEVSCLVKMDVVRRGNRLSVQPVSPEAWKVILKLPQWN